MTRTACFFVQGMHERGDRIAIDDADVHHINAVLRLHAGDRIEIVDSASRAFVAELEGDSRHLGAKLVEEVDVLPDDDVRIDVAQALPKGAKMDFVIEKATELGAAAIVPFTSERTVVRSPAGERVARWNRIARSAAEQSGRREIPVVATPISYADLLRRFGEYDCTIFAWESANETLRERLPGLLRNASRVLVVVGPEGGFTLEESAAARNAGAVVVSLGRRILRTETAALALLVVLDYERAAQTE